MDPERVPVRAQSEVSPRVYDLGEGNSRTIQPDPFRMAARFDTSNLSPSAPNAPPSPSSEKSEPIQPPIPVRRGPESDNRETGMNNDDTRLSNTMSVHGIDWIVPTESKRHTVGDRLQPTIDIAISEKDKYAAKAKMSGYALNAAIGMQVVLGSLTTGLSALSVVGGASIAKATTALGALATLVASYLARARGSNEPDLSIARTKDLEQFIRECQAFQLDHGHKFGGQFDEKLIGFRRRFEELLGNANGEQTPSSSSGDDSKGSPQKPLKSA